MPTLISPDSPSEPGRSLTTSQEPMFVSKRCVNAQTLPAVDAQAVLHRIAEDFDDDFSNTAGALIHVGGKRLGPGNLMRLAFILEHASAVNNKIATMRFWRRWQMAPSREFVAQHIFDLTITAGSIELVTGSVYRTAGMQCAWADTIADASSTLESPGLRYSGAGVRMVEFDTRGADAIVAAVSLTDAAALRIASNQL